MARKHLVRAHAAPGVPGEPDLESRLTEDNHGSLKLWLRMLSCTNLIEAGIRSRLRTEFGITLPRFDLMAQLDRHPEGLRMSELSKRMMVTGGNVTGIARQLEQEGLVARDAVPGDGRAWSVRLTPDGQRAFGRMASKHEGWIRELMAGLTEQERATVFNLLSTLKRGLVAPAATEK